MSDRSLYRLYRDEFSAYSFAKFKKDLIAGLSVAAGTLPLALGFGIASGANAFSGIVTAIFAGLIIGLLSGAPYQISGPTGTMAVVLILLVSRYGLAGIWLTGFLSGVFLLVIGLLRLGRFIAFIPAPVVSGFTSGVALIIIVGQFDNLFGVRTPYSEVAAQKIIGYFTGDLAIDIHAVLLGICVIGIMLLWPNRWNKYLPSALVATVFAAALNYLMNWSVNTIGQFPQSFLLVDRLRFGLIPWENFSEFLAPAITITVLSAVESLSSGAIGSKITGVRLQANQELIAQGVGNILIPFFGGIPATAAVVRTSEGIKAGGQTRMVSVVHAIGIVAFVILFAPLMTHIPLSVLAGVLIVTAIRMIDWDTIKFIIGKKFKTDLVAFFLAMIATISFDLTQAILIGVFLSGVVFFNKFANVDITVQVVDIERVRQKGIQVNGDCERMHVMFVKGALFYTALDQFNEALLSIDETHNLILSMRGVTLLDTAALEAIFKLAERFYKQGRTLMFAEVPDNVLGSMEHGGFIELIGEENFFWSTDQAIVEAGRRGCKFC